jgi:beta-lactamase superfamily II metal-dependent hydrolase
VLFAQNEALDPPDRETLEVTVIGPGYGEAVLVHIGDGKWIAIDSCSNTKDRTSLSRRYLQSIGAKLTDIIAVICTHWDDDHIRGFFDLADHAINAKLVIASAFVKKDFLAYANLFGRPLTQKTRSKLSEIVSTIELFASRNGGVSYALGDRRIFDRQASQHSHKQACELWTLSPSDAEHNNFLSWISSQFPRGGETRRIVTSRIRNDLSIVTLVVVGKDAILLGGDLEEPGSSDRGWSAILSSSGRPSSKSSVFKVPHHGSSNAHHDRVWKELLQDDAYAVVSPWKMGGRSIPEESDLQRIKGFTPNGFLSAPTKRVANIKRPQAVQKTIKEVALDFGTISQEPGMVRLRKKAGTKDSWKAELFAGAIPIA